MRSQLAQARTLFERAAKVDGKNPVVVANLEALEKADMAQQVAEAREKEDRAKAKARTKVTGTMIVRSDRRVQTLVTKPDPETLEVARESGTDPRAVHTPEPMIEIATKSPVQVEAIRPVQRESVSAAAATAEPQRLKAEPAPTTSTVLAEVAPAAKPRLTVEPAAPAAVKVAKAAPAANGTVKRQTPAAKAAVVPEPVPASAPPVKVTIAKAKPKPASDVAPAAEPMVTMTLEKAPAKPLAAEAPKVKITLEMPASDPAPAQRKTAVAKPSPAEEAAVSAITGEPAPRQPVITAVPAPAAAQAAPQGDALPKLNADVARDVEAAWQTEVAALEPVALLEPEAPKPEIAPLPDVAAEPDKVAIIEPAEAAANVSVKADAKAAPAKRSSLPTPLPEVAVTPKQTAALDAKTEPGRGLPAKAAQPKVNTSNSAAELKALRAAVRIEVSNGAGRLDMAMRMGQYLVDQGMKPASLTNAISFTNKVSVLYFRPGYIASAKSLSRLLPVDPELRRNAALRTDLRLVLGGDLLDFDRDLIDKPK